MTHFASPQVARVDSSPLPPRVSLVGGFAQEEVTTLIDAALTDLGGRRLERTAALLWRARALADRAERRPDRAMARFALTLEHALRGDIEVGGRHLADAVRVGQGLPATAFLGPALECVFEVKRGDALLACGVRRLAREIWEAARSRFDHAQKSADEAALSARERRMLNLAGVAIEAASPDRTWVVGPNAHWVDPPKGGPIDLSHRALLRRLWLTLLASREEGLLDTIPPHELCARAWRSSEHPSSAVMRNRLKVAIASMRRLGLAEALPLEPRGYRLAPDQRYLMRHTVRPAPRSEQANATQEGHAPGVRDA
jgi:hypothetical protein